MHKNPLRSLFQKGDLSRAKDMDKDTERVRTERPTDRTFLHKITICIKILILLIFPYHLYLYVCMYGVFSLPISLLSSARLNMKRILNGQRKDRSQRSCPSCPKCFVHLSCSFFIYFFFFVAFFLPRLCFVKSLNIIFPLLLGRCETFREFQMS